MHRSSAKRFASLLGVVGWLGACSTKEASPPPSSVVEVAIVVTAAPEVMREPLRKRPVAALVLAGFSPNMPLSEVRDMLGKEDESHDLDGALAIWRAAGYDPDHELPFMIGFDTMLAFNRSSRDENKPFWDVYARDGRAVLFKVAVSESASDEALKHRFGFEPSCFLNTDASGIMVTFGTFAEVRIDGQHRTFHYYLRRGVGVMEQEGHIQVLDLFEPFSEERARQVGPRIMPNAERPP